MITDEDLEDIITDAIADSFDQDWSARDGAKAVLRAFVAEGLTVQPRHVPECRAA